MPAANAGDSTAPETVSAPSDASPDRPWRANCAVGRWPPARSTGYWRLVPKCHTTALHVEYGPALATGAFNARVVRPSPPPPSGSDASTS